MTSADLTSRIGRRLDELLGAVAVAHGEDPRAAGLLVAFSGGPDSLALLWLARSWALARGRPLLAAHFNHRLRGADADRDEDFCRQMCDRLQVAIVCAGGDPRPLARERGRGLEEAARRLRLDFLEEARRAHGLCAVATGHHRDDQAETVLMRIGRGTGLDGLRGMRPRRGRIIRPLLAVARREILALLQERGLAWREDATNRDGSNTRSRVRRELLPLLRDIFGAGAARNPARLAELAGTDLAYLDATAAAALADLAVAPPEPSADSADSRPPAGLAVGRLLALPDAIRRRVLRLWLQPLLPVDLARIHVRQIERWLAGGQSGSGLDLPGPLRLVREFDSVHVAQAPPPGRESDRWSVRIAPLDEVPPQVPAPWRAGDAWHLISAADHLAGGLCVRAPRAGDRLQPFGFAGHRKLSDLMREKRVALAARRHVLVVADREGPVWVVGLAQDERTRVLPATRQAVTIIVERRP